jgi:hypothetical protein
VGKAASAITEMLRNFFQLQGQEIASLEVNQDFLSQRNHFGISDIHQTYVIDQKTQKYVYIAL